MRFRSTPSQSIFLSYAHKSDNADDFDQSEELVKLIRDELVRDGHQVFFDRHDIRSGNDWRAQITDAILHHDVFFSFLSRRSVRDPGVCLNEINIAIGNGKRVQTFLLESEERACPPLTVTHIQWLDLQTWLSKRHGADWDQWFAAQMVEIRRILADGEQARVVGELQRLRDILQPNTFEAVIARKTADFSGRQWLFDEHERWLAEGSSKVFWIKGAPGIGKSAFAAALVSRAKTVVIGSYFCDYQAQKLPEEAAKEAISTLAYQIASRLPDYRARLLFRDFIDQTKIRTMNADALFQYLITEPLCQSTKIPEAYRMTLVIDGLDEAGHARGGNVLADLLAKHADRLPNWLGIVITSRAEPYLERQFNQFSRHEVNSDTPDNLHDIRTYLHSVIDPDIDMQAREDIVDNVLTKSEGIFLYARLLADSAPDWRNLSAMPQGLDGFYTATFKRYFPDVDAYLTCQERFLDLLTAAPGALPRQLAQKVLQWHGAQLQRHVIEPLGAFLVDTGAGLALFHKSLNDWLTSPQRSGPYAVSAGGRRQLGVYLYGQFEHYASSNWQHEVKNWIPVLLQHTPEWDSPLAVRRLAHWYAEAHDLTTAIYLADRWRTLQAQSTGQQSVEHALALAQLGYWCTQICQYERARATFEVSLNIYKAHLPQEKENVISVLTDLAHLWDRLGSPQHAVKYFQEALMQQRQVSPQNYDQLNAKLADLCGRLVQLGELDVARTLFEEIHRIYRDHDAETTLDPFVLQMMAQYAEAIGDVQQTRELLTMSIKSLERCGEGARMDLATLLHNYAYVCIDAKDEQEAVTVAERAHHLRTQHCAPKAPEFARSRNLLANVLLVTRHYQDALALVTENLDEYSQLASDQVTEAIAADMADTKSLAGLIYGHAGQHDLALEYFENAVGILEQLLPFKHAAFIAMSNHIIDYLERLGRGQEADNRRKRTQQLLVSHGFA